MLSALAEFFYIFIACIVVNFVLGYFVYAACAFAGYPVTPNAAITVAIVPSWFVVLGFQQ